MIWVLKHNTWHLTVTAAVFITELLNILVQKPNAANRKHLGPLVVGCQNNVSDGFHVIYC